MPLAAQKNEPPPAPPRVTINARDADVRATLQDLFKQAKIANFALANDVRGTVTISLREKPFEEALTIVARIASPPLAWSKNDGFYQVKLRASSAVTSLETQTPASVALGDGTRVEVIRLMYADARDIVTALGAVKPSGLQAAIAYEPNNRVLSRWGWAGTNGVAAGPRLPRVRPENSLLPPGVEPPLTYAPKSAVK